MSSGQDSRKRRPARKTAEDPHQANRAADLETFIKKVNKEDRHNGLKIRFSFTKRKRR